MAASRGPGHRAGLNRRAVLDAALGIADRDGIKALSMRRLGAELGVEAMTLYHHVPNKDALLDGLVELVVAEAGSPRFEGVDWTRGLRDYARRLLDALLAHRAVIPLVTTRAAATPQNLRTVEAALAALVEAGFTPRQAMDVTFTLSGFVAGQAATLAQVEEDDANRARGQVDLLSRLDSADYPLLTRAAAEARHEPVASRFDFALDAMLTGFAAALPDSA